MSESDSVKLFNEVKQIIKSILITNDQDTTIKQLRDDYMEIEGRPIPFRQLGFSTLEAMLEAPEFQKDFSCTTNPWSQEITLTAKVTQETAHIQALVRGQKKVQPRRRGLTVNAAKRYHSVKNSTKTLLVSSLYKPFSKYDYVSQTTSNARPSIQPTRPMQNFSKPNLKQDQPKSPTTMSNTTQRHTQVPSPTSILKPLPKSSSPHNKTPPSLGSNSSLPLLRTPNSSNSASSVYYSPQSKFNTSAIVNSSILSSGHETLYESLIRSKPFIEMGFKDVLPQCYRNMQFAKQGNSQTSAPTVLYNFHMPTCDAKKSSNKTSISNGCNSGNLQNHLTQGIKRETNSKIDSSHVAATGHSSLQMTTLGKVNDEKAIAKEQTLTVFTGTFNEGTACEKKNDSSRGNDTYSVGQSNNQLVNDNLSSRVHENTSDGESLTSMRRPYASSETALGSNGTRMRRPLDSSSRQRLF